MFDVNRRGFIRGVGLLLAAPAIVRVSSLMPVKSMEISSAEILEAMRQVWIRAIEVTDTTIQDALYRDFVGRAYISYADRVVLKYPWQVMIAPEPTKEVA